MQKWPFVQKFLYAKVTSRAKPTPCKSVFVHIWPFVQKCLFMHTRLLPKNSILNKKCDKIKAIISNFNWVNSKCYNIFLIVLNKYTFSWKVHRGLQTFALQCNVTLTLCFFTDTEKKIVNQNKLIYFKMTFCFQRNLTF